MPDSRDDRRPPRVEDDLDDYDDLPPEPHRRPPRPTGGGFATVVPYRNGAALAAYYIGVFGLIPILGFVFGPLAIILGVIGLVKARKNPQAHGTGHAIAGIVLGVIDPLLWIVVIYVMRSRML
jgi:uncharacterized protein YqgC (DUF456 family)